LEGAACSKKGDGLRTRSHTIKMLESYEVQQLFRLALAAVVP
jgi:hypothetical protein